MVSGPAGPLTRTAFRRDVRLFLTGLVGFLILLILLLLLFLRVDLERTEKTIDHSEGTIADVAADAVNATPAENLETQLVFFRSRFGAVQAVIARKGGAPIASGTAALPYDEVTRVTRAGVLTLRFDGSERAAARRRFLLTAVICVAAVSFGSVLLFSFLPRITRPIEDMLEQARELGGRGSGQDETAYLIDTFRHSIATLKSQEEELKRLHELEKTRADDLERVTAALTHSLTSGLLAADAEGRLVDINAAGREILGVGAAEAVAGRTIDDVVPLAAFSAAVGRACEERTPLSRIEIDDVQPDGEAVIIGLTTVPLRNQSGAFLGFLALFTDLTPIRSLEARVQEMTTLAQLGEISAGIAHELRNSVTTILGYMKLARRGEAEARLQSAEKEAAALLEAIDRLVAFARPVELNAETVGLKELIAEQAERLAEQAPGVALRIAGPELFIDGDRVLLARAFENLLRNAFDAVRAKGGGSVSVTLSDEPRAVTIADDGVGFDPAETARLFLPFHSNKPNGFGMGLPLAKKIVLLHGGTLRLQGQPDKGATATIELGAAGQAADVLR
jgi:PAS domain S-box-containing protein